MSKKVLGDRLKFEALVKFYQRFSTEGLTEAILSIISDFEYVKSK